MIIGPFFLDTVFKNVTLKISTQVIPVSSRKTILQQCRF